MMIWGRLIGILLGYKVLGLLGAIIGFFVGSWFDQGLPLNHQSNNDEYRYTNNGRDRQTASSSQMASLHNAYGVLGVLPSAAPAEVKKAYRRLMNQHHPDKLAARGLPESMIKLAKEKTQQIRAAYDLVREAKGFR